MNLDALEQHLLAAVANDTLLPLDEAVALMGHGIDVTAIEGHPLFDPYFND